VTDETPPPQPARDPASRPASTRRLTRRRILLGLLALAAIPLFLLGRAWKTASDNGGQQFAEPFRIAGNFYYVGANDVAAFLITGPEGHVLIDGGYPGTPPLIMRSIAKLGFDIRDVKVLLNSEPHGDHAGGLGALKQASGGEIWASDASADVIEAGGDDPDIHWALRPLFKLGITGYPDAPVARRLADGDTVRVGPVALTAHVTPGHTRGCTTWTFKVQDGDRELDVVSACTLVVLGASRYPAQAADLERTVARLRAMPADIWVTSHARLWGRYRKYAARDTAANPVDPFIDPEGYRAFIDTGEARFRRGHVQ
jgi:metallo-beta-lactamase class B